MTTYVIEYDDAGQITDWRFEVRDDYTAGENETTETPGEFPPRRVDRGEYEVDTAVDPPELVDNPDFEPSEVLDRARVSTTSKDEYRTQRQNALDARTAGDRDAELDALRAMVDNLFEILTGEEP